MSDKFRALIGREFVVDGVTYTICEILREDRQDFVEALPSVADAQGVQVQRVRFPLAVVLESLLVEEEIVLYQATFLGASETYKAAG